MVRPAGSRSILLASLIALLGIGLFVPGVARAQVGPCPNADTNSAELSMPQFDQSVFCLINQSRAENHLRPLRPSGLLHDAADIYATSQLSGEFFGHYGCLNGKNNCATPIGRLRFLGYIRPGWAWIVGETLQGSHADEATPNLVVNAWLGSPLHRAELLKAKFRDLGVASVRGVADDFPSTDGVTVAAEFGFRKKRKGGRRG
jgi:uncharacterized protein YkwD